MNIISVAAALTKFLIGTANTADKKTILDSLFEKQYPTAVSMLDDDTKIVTIANTDKTVYQATVITYRSGSDKDVQITKITFFRDGSLIEFKNVGGDPLQGEHYKIYPSIIYDAGAVKVKLEKTIYGAGFSDLVVNIIVSRL